MMIIMKKQDNLESIVLEFNSMISSVSVFTRLQLCGFNRGSKPVVGLYIVTKTNRRIHVNTYKQGGM